MAEPLMKPVARGSLRPLRREVSITDAQDNEPHSSEQNLLEELHEDSVESIDNVHSLSEIRKPPPRKGTFGLGNPDTERSSGSSPLSVPQTTLTSRSDKGDPDESTVEHVQAVKTEKLTERSVLYGDDDDDEINRVNEDPHDDVKSEGTSRVLEGSSEPSGTKRRIRFEEQSEMAEEDQAKSKDIKEKAKDEGEQEGGVKTGQKLKQRFRLRFGGKKGQQIDVKEQQRDASSVKTPEDVESEPKEEMDDAQEKQEPTEKPSDQVNVVTKRPRFVLPKLGRNRAKAEEKPTEKESPSTPREEDPQEGDQVDNDQVEGDVKDQPVEEQTTTKRRGLGFIPRFRTGRSPAPQETTSDGIGEVEGVENRPEHSTDQREETKAVESETGEGGRRRTFGAPWRRRRNTQENTKSEQKKDTQGKQTPPAITPEEDDDDRDDDDDEVGQIMQEGRAEEGQQQNGSAEERASSSAGDTSKGSKPWSRFRFGYRRQQDEQPKEQDSRTTSRNDVEGSPLPYPGTSPATDTDQRGPPLPPLNTAHGPGFGGAETRVQVEQEHLPERVVPEEPQDDEDVFISRLFIDRFLIQRQHAPLPSSPPASGSTIRSVAPKPVAPNELYGSFLLKAGRAAQGLLGGLCLFFLLVLLSGDDDEVKRMFGGTGDGGGQTQILQMVIYFLVIISVITSFDGLNYQQMMVERRPNRFAFTSVIYPAMLILGLTITKLDNKLAYGGGVTQEEWLRWKGVNMGRCACGLAAWIVLCL